MHFQKWKVKAKSEWSKIPFLFKNSESCELLVFPRPSPRSTIYLYFISRDQVEIWKFRYQIPFLPPLITGVIIVLCVVVVVRSFCVFVVVNECGWLCGKAELRLKINFCFPAKMQPENEGLLEIMDLARTLRQEQLFIQSEQSAFRNLNDQLTRNSSLVCQLAWICAQQRQNLSDLITSRPETGPTVCCQRSNRLENTKFVDAFKAKTLKYEVSWFRHTVIVFKYLLYLFALLDCANISDSRCEVVQLALCILLLLESIFLSHFWEGLFVISVTVRGKWLCLKIKSNSRTNSAIWNKKRRKLNNIAK